MQAQRRRETDVSNGAQLREICFWYPPCSENRP